MSVPAQLGNYKLEKEIGRGATSEVWLARHAYLNDHLVAVKVLMSQDREAIRRFQREAAIAARLRHPNITQLFDYGYQQPFFFTVLEYVPGGSLRQLLERQGALQLTDALAIFKQIAAALDYAHSLSVIHRDVAPGNILVDPSGRALLTDFGIARDPGQPITIANSIMGTPGYLSPEHAQSATSVTHLSDLFCLGVLLYQMLSGELPWKEVPGLPEGVGFTQPIPLKERGVEGLPSDVDRVLRTMLAMDPTRRFPAARAAVGELDRIFSRHQMTTQIILDGATATVPAAQLIDFQSGGVEANAVEGVLGPDLVRAPIDRAHHRADELRNPTTITALLDAWAAQSILRRRFLGRLARLHKITSHNVYFFRLRVLYERRSPAEDDEEPDRKAAEIPISPEMDRWLIPLPPPKDFTNEAGERVTIPGSARIADCPTCQGKGATPCPRCKGQRRITVMRPAATPAAPGAALGLPSGGGQAASGGAGSGRPPAPGGAADPGAAKAPGGPAAPGAATAQPPPRMEAVVVACPECEGRGGFVCKRCAGVRRLILRKAFRWQRTADVLNAQDDLPDVDEDWLYRACKAEVIYTERQAGGARPEWLLIPNLSGLIQRAQERVDNDTRIILTEVSVSFIPVTDVVFDLGKPGDAGLYKLSIYGFENLIPADWRFFNWERVLSLGAILFLILVSLIALAFLIMR